MLRVRNPHQDEHPPPVPQVHQGKKGNMTMPATTKTIESADLYFQEGSSDKVYHARLEDEGSGYSVFFSYGRRGGNMTEGYKVRLAPEEVARKEYDKLVASKIKKGYQY
jgi:bifunctional non-homologous end joining protein LigD